MSHDLMLFILSEAGIGGRSDPLLRALIFAESSLHELGQGRFAIGTVATAAPSTEEQIGRVCADLEVRAMHARDQQLAWLQTDGSEPVQILATLRVVEQSLEA